MKNESVPQKMIDVVEDFSFPYQNLNYQENFRIWRRRKKNPYAFRFTKNPKESAFSESHAVGAKSPSKVEQVVLNRLGYLIGCILICYLVIENIFDKIAVLIMRTMHLQIEMVLLGQSRLYGDENLIFWLSFLINFLKYLIPAFIMQVFLKLPPRVSLPIHIRKPSLLIGGITLTMLLNIGFGIFDVSRSSELEKYRLISNAVNNDDHRIILYILVAIFVLPFITELLLHGCMFQVMRQFGDMFAVITTAVLAVALTHNIWDALLVGLVHLTISYYLIKTGSFLSVIVIRFVHEIYMFAMFCIETYHTVYSLEWWLLFLVPCILSIAVCISIFLKRKQTKELIPENATYLTMLEKLTAFFTTMPMTVFLICCVLLMVITAILT